MTKVTHQIDDVFIDKIGFFSLLALLGVSPTVKVVKVISFNEHNFNVYRILLKLFNIELVKFRFFAGKINTKSGENIVFNATKHSNKLSYKVADTICDTYGVVKKINERYNKNVIKSFLAKRAHALLMPTILQCTLVDSLNNECPVLFVKKSGALSYLPEIDKDFGVKLIQYDDIVADIVSICAEVVFSVGRYIKNIWRNYFLHWDDKEPEKNLSLPSVFMLQEDTVRFDDTLRNQPHWVRRTAAPIHYNKFILQHMRSLTVHKADTKPLALCNVFLLPMRVLNRARCENSHLAQKLFSEDVFALITTLLRVKNVHTQMLFIKLIFLMFEARAMYTLFRFLNVRTFVFRDSYNSLTDACLIVSPMAKVKTIGYQYSNLPVNTPITTTPCDIFVTFSKMFNKNFTAFGIGPKSFCSYGYLYMGLSNRVLKRANKKRLSLMKSGADKILVYFDEAIVEGEWSVINRVEHLKSLHILIKFVTSNPSYGLIIKPKFAFNRPSCMYPDDEQLTSLLATGRYLEDVEGSHRNDCYPMESALAGDFCICEKFGATAALEAAVYGKRAILLNSYPLRTEWDHIYNQADINYPSLELAIESIKKFYQGNKEYQGLGDWSSILDFFSEDGPTSPRESLQALIEENII